MMPVTGGIGHAIDIRQGLGVAEITCLPNRQVQGNRGANTPVRGDLKLSAEDKIRVELTPISAPQDHRPVPIVYFWGNQRREAPAPVPIEEFVPSKDKGKGGHPDDALMDAARELARESANISTSFLQQRLRIGYPRAARIMDQLEEEGFQRGVEEIHD